MSGRLEGYPQPTRLTGTISPVLSCDELIDPKLPEEIELLGSADYVKAPNVPETFLISMYPPSAESYWEAMIKSGAQIGVQLEQSGVPYHLKVGGAITLGFGTIHLLNQRSVGRLVTEREYLLTDSEGKTRTFIHYCLLWEDYGIPQGAAFAELMSTYRDRVQSLLKESSVAPKVHIHCRAGRGRSGTFAFARSLECQPKDGSMSGEVLLEAMRNQRGGLVESSLQEQFAYSSVRGFDSYGKLSALYRYSAQGRISWIGSTGMVEALGFGKQILVWLATVINLRRWAIRHLMDFDSSLNRMIDLRDKILPLSKGQPSLTHRYWQCWDIFRKTFELSSDEIDKLKAKEPEVIDLQSITLGSPLIVDIKSLLDHYHHPLDLVTSYLDHGMLGQAFWIIDHCKLDLESMKTTLEPEIYGWFLLQKELKSGQELSFEAVAQTQYCDENKNLKIGLGLGQKGAARWMAAKKRATKSSLSNFPISELEIRAYLQSLVFPKVAQAWQIIFSNMGKLRAISGAIEMYGQQYQSQSIPKELMQQLIIKKQDRNDIIETTAGIIGYLRKSVQQVLTQHPFMNPALEKWIKEDPTRKIAAFACDVEDGFEPDQSLVARSSTHQVSHMLAMLLANSLPKQISAVDATNPEHMLTLPPLPVWLETVPFEAESEETPQKLSPPSTEV